MYNNIRFYRKYTSFAIEFINFQIILIKKGGKMARNIFEDIKTLEQQYYCKIFLLKRNHILNTENCQNEFVDTNMGLLIKNLRHDKKLDNLLNDFSEIEMLRTLNESIAKEYVIETSALEYVYYDELSFLQPKIRYTYCIMPLYCEMSLIVASREKYIDNSSFFRTCRIIYNKYKAS